MQAMSLENLKLNLQSKLYVCVFVFVVKCQENGGVFIGEFGGRYT